MPDSKGTKKCRRFKPNQRRYKMKKSIFSKFASVAAVAVISVFFLAGCAEDPANNNGGGYDNPGSSDSSGGGGGSGSSSSGGGNNSSSTLKAPAGVTAEGSSSKSITITWNAVAGTSQYPVSSYYVYRSDEASGPYALVDYAISKTSYTNSNLAAYTTFYYKVAACSSNCYSTDRAVLGEQSSAVPATTFLVAPSGVNATSETSSSITISWNNLQDATAYRIFKSGSSGGTYTEIGTSTSNSYTDTGLPTKVQYYYEVSGYNSITEGDKSSYVYATTLLKAPTGVTATANSSSSITITWNAVTDASYYNVYRSDEASGLYVQVDYCISRTSYTNSSLSPGTTFYYKVSASSRCSSSEVSGEQSAAVSATTLN
jgi:fibronectin type 3 domain-containing protein